MAGRPSKWTPEVRQKICQALAQGQTKKAAATFAGVSESLLCEWIAKGSSAKSGEFLEFLESIEKAENEAEMVRVTRIQNAGANGNWTADAWWLERRRPDSWKVKQAVEHGGANGGPIEIRIIWDDRPPTQ